MRFSNRIQQVAKTGVFCALLLLMVGTVVGYAEGESGNSYNDEPASAYYWVVHEYYRDENLTALIGTQGLEENEDELNSEHTADSGMYITTYNGNSNYVHKEDAYGTKSGESWTEESSKTCAVASADSNEIIIMRYYLTGSYNVRHEYYTIPYTSSATVENVSLDDPDLIYEEGKTKTDKIERCPLDTHYSAKDVTPVPGASYTYRDDWNDHETTDGQTGPDGYVLSTEEGTDTIVLRYVKKEQPPETGYYNVIHKYWLESNGKRTAEGEETEVPGHVNLPNNKQYTTENVTKRTMHTWENTSYEYEYRPTEDSYESASGTYVRDTKDGDETIILNYVRTLDEGFYRVVHEYYENEIAPANLVGRTDIEPTELVALPDSTQHTEAEVGRITEYEGVTYTYVEAAYGKMSGASSYSADASMSSVAATANGEQVIILRYVRNTNVGSYNVVHEYYLRDGEDLIPEGTEGPFAVEDVPLDGAQYTASGVDRILQHTYNGATYTYAHDNDAYGKASANGYAADEAMTYVTATENGEEYIILRYVRSASDDDDRYTPDDTPDPNDPDSPETITVWEDDVPLTYVKVWDPEEEEWVYVPEDDVPLYNREVPQTGDEYHNVMWGVLALVSLGGLAVLYVTKRRSEER